MTSMTKLRAIGAMGLFALALSAGRARADIPDLVFPETVIARIEPAAAAPGAQVTITGLYFVPGARVWIGGAEATDVKVLSGEQIVATVPDHAPGKVSVQVRLPMWRSAYRSRAFTYLAAGESKG
jgi:hypothetical protein